MRYLFLAIISSLVLPSLSFASHSTSNHLVINELGIDSTVGTGGSQDDWVEILNPGDCPIDLSTWSIQKQTSTGSLSKKNFEAGMSVTAHGFFLITYTTARADLLALSDMKASAVSLSENGTVYLVDDQKDITGKDDPNIVDMVGWGSPFAAEGDPATSPPEAQSITRTNGIDTDDNEADLTIATQPTPNNRQSPIVSQPGTCETPPPPSPAPTPSSPGTNPPPPSGVSGENIATVASARALPNGQTITVEGVVTATPGQLSTTSFYMQDETGGLQIYSSKKLFPPLTIGARVKVRGDLSEVYNEKRLKTVAVSDIEIIGAGKVATYPRKTGEIGEDREGLLVTLTGTVSQTSGDTFFIDDGSGEAKIYIKAETKIDKPAMKRGDSVKVTGIVSQYKDQYRVMPRQQNDLSVGSIVEKETGTEEQSDEVSPSASEQSQQDEMLAEPTIAGAASDVTAKPSLANVSRNSKVLAWGTVGLGSLLLLLLPLLLWEKRHGWLRARLSKQNNSSASWQKD